MAHLRQPFRSHSARWWPVAGVVYSPLVLGLAIFLISLLCCRTAPPEYHAEAVMLKETGTFDGANGPIAVWLKSDAVLRAALTNTKWPELTNRKTVADQNQLIAELRNRVAITALSQPDERPRLSIICSAPRGSVAMNLVSELVMQVADHFEPQQRELARRQANERLSQFDDRIRTLREAEERHRGELERLRHSQLAMVVASPRGQGDSRWSSNESANLNPRWIELKQQLDALQSQRTEMLEVLQENHPEIDGLNLRIAKVTGSLSKTPRQLSTPVPSISHKASATSHGQPLMEWRRESFVVQQQYQQEGAPITREGLDPFLNMAAQIDETSHQLAVTISQRKGIEWDKAELEQSQTDLLSAPQTAWRAVSDRRVAKIGGGYSSRQLWWAGLLSLGITGALVCSQWTILSSKRLATMTDVLVNVRLPIVGTVEVPARGIESDLNSRRAPLLRLFTRCGEAFLLGVALTCLASAWLDPYVAADFLTAPLDAFAATARRIL